MGRVERLRRAQSHRQARFWRHPQGWTPEHCRVAGTRGGLIYAESTLPHLIRSYAWTELGYRRFRGDGGQVTARETPLSAHSPHLSVQTNTEWSWSYMVGDKSCIWRAESGESHSASKVSMSQEKMSRHPPFCRSSSQSRTWEVSGLASISATFNIAPLPLSARRLPPLKGPFSSQPLQLRLGSASVKTLSHGNHHVCQARPPSRRASRPGPCRDYPRRHGLLPARRQYVKDGDWATPHVAHRHD